MWGCWSRAATLISRSNRSLPTEAASSGSTTLSATGRSRLMSCARYTEAMPPRPSSRWISYRPARAVRRVSRLSGKGTAVVKELENTTTDLPRPAPHYRRARLRGAPRRGGHAAHERDVVGRRGLGAALPEQQGHLAAVVAPVQCHVEQDVLDCRAERESRAVGVGDLALEIVSAPGVEVAGEAGVVLRREAGAGVEIERGPDRHVGTNLLQAGKPDVLGAEDMGVELERPGRDRRGAPEGGESALIRPLEMPEEAPQQVRHPAPQNSRFFISLKKRLVSGSCSSGLLRSVLSYWAARSAFFADALAVFFLTSAASRCSSRFDMDAPLGGKAGPACPAAPERYPGRGDWQSGTGAEGPPGGRAGRRSAVGPGGGLPPSGSRFFQRDLSVDVQRRQDAGNRERRAHREPLPARNRAARQRVPDRFLHLPLGGDGEGLEQLPQLEVEQLFVHWCLPLIPTL